VVDWRPGAALRPRLEATSDEAFAGPDQPMRLLVHPTSGRRLPIDPQALAAPGKLPFSAHLQPVPAGCGCQIRFFPRALAGSPSLVPVPARVSGRVRPSLRGNPGQSTPRPVRDPRWKGVLFLCQTVSRRVCRVRILFSFFLSGSAGVLPFPSGDAFSPRLGVGRWLSPADRLACLGFGRG